MLFRFFFISFFFASHFSRTLPTPVYQIQNLNPESDNEKDYNSSPLKKVILLCIFFVACKLYMFVDGAKRFNYLSANRNWSRGSLQTTKGGCITFPGKKKKKLYWIQMCCYKISTKKRRGKKNKRSWRLGTIPFLALFLAFDDKMVSIFSRVIIVEI